MATTLADISGKVLRLVQKKAATPGFFTELRVNDAINDCLNYITARMMMNGEGWFLEIGTLTPTAGQSRVALPTGCSVIKAVRYKCGDAWHVLTYNEQLECSQYESSTTVGYPSEFRVVGTDLYFNPVPSEITAGCVQIEYCKYPTALLLQADTLNAAFDNALLEYCKWRAASQLSAQVGKMMPEWKPYEDEWYVVMKELLGKRIITRQVIGSFDR